MTERIKILVSYRLRTSGKMVGYPMALPAGADPHLVPTSAVLAGIAKAIGVAQEEIELVDLDVHAPGR